MAKDKSAGCRSTRAKASRLRRIWPKSRWGRCAFVLGSLFLLLLAMLGLVIGSIWIEDKHPSDDPELVLFPRTQRWVSRPIVEALGRRVQDYVRGQAEAKYLKTGLTLKKTISRFLDEDIPMSERRVYAYRLAKEASPEAVAALLKVLGSAAPTDKAFMAALIGKTGNPAGKEWLRPLLRDPHKEVVIGALKGLSLIGGEDVTGWAAEILRDGGRAETIRVEAAVALGTIHTPGSRDALVAAFAEMPSEAIAGEILNGLGRYPFDEVAPTFQAFLTTPKASEELRTAAVEALALSTREAVPFLLDEAAGDASAEVRAMAAWAISAHQDETRLGPQLAGMTENEAEADVRRRLYEALLPQAEIPAARLLPRVLAEQDPAARIAGFNALGRAARLNPASPETADFDAQIVPELKRAAGEANSMNLRMRAVFALRRAGTPASVRALEAHAGHADKTIATAASNGLRASSSRKP